MDYQLSHLPDERMLFARMAKGDEEAFAEIFYHYTALLQPFILNMTRSEADTEEIIQDLFLQLWMQREKMPEIGNYRAYIFTASNNRVYTWLKRRARELRLSAEAGSGVADQDSRLEEALDLKESMALITEAVDRLPPQKKLIWRLSREEGLSHEQIAGQLGLSKNTVKNHMVAAIRMVRKYLQEHSEEAGAIAGVLVMMWEATRIN